MTFNSIYERWKDEKSKTLKPVSLATYGMLAEGYILPEVGEKESVSEPDFLAVREAALRKGASPKTAEDVSVLLMGILRYAARNGWWPMPAWSVKTGNTRNRREASVLTLAQERILLRYCESSRSPRDIGLYLAVTAGLRMGELALLKWQDIDEENALLHVRGDESAPRDLPLAPDQLQLLLEEAKTRPGNHYIVSDREVPAKLKVIRGHLQRVFRTLRIPDHPYKDLRDTFAVRCLETGCPYSTLARLMGVTRIDSLVKMYNAFLPEDSRSRMCKMMKALQ